MRIVTFSAKLEFGVRAVLVGSLDVQFVRTGSCSIRFCQQRGDAGMNEPAQRFCEPRRHYISKLLFFGGGANAGWARFLHARQRSRDVSHVSHSGTIINEECRQKDCHCMVSDSVCDLVG